MKCSTIMQNATKCERLKKNFISDYQSSLSKKPLKKPRKNVVRKKYLRNSWKTNRPKENAQYVSA